MDVLVDHGVQFVEKLSKVAPLLACHLRRGGVLREGAVAQRPDIFHALHTKVVVHNQSPPAVLHRANLLDQVCDHGPGRVARDPHKHAIGHVRFLARLHGLHCQLVLPHVGHRQPSLHRDRFGLCEVFLRVVNQLLVEHSKDLGKRLHQRDFDAVLELRECALGVALKEVRQLARELHARRATPHHHKMKQAVNLAAGLAGDACRL
mmetsp:Transcript_46620/g.117413  ORF Transcript_46620/g.117413 Transcript_46620/m.117413 type:complete len:206 (-) Transcript_46620:861-1478(-)